MALDVVKWLKEDLGLTGDGLDTVVAALTPAADKIEKGYLRQSDYSRHQDALRSDQQKLADATANLEAEIAAWAGRQAAGEPITAQMRKDLNEAREKALKLQQAVEAAALAGGQDPAAAVSAALGGAAPVKADTPPPFDPKQFVSPDQLGNSLSALATMSLKWPATFARIAREHHMLTGQELDGEAIVAEIQKRAGTKGNQKSLDPAQVWEEIHDISPKRAAAAEKKQAELISAAEARGREAALSELATPHSSTPPRPGSRPSPLLHPPQQNGHAGERKSVINRPQPGGAVQAAAAAFRSGKYRNGGAAGDGRTT